MNPQDPLESLRPLREPDLIGWWPLAPGWWLLLALVLLALAAGAYLLIKRHRRNAYRRQALQQLEDLQAQLQSNNDSNRYIAAINGLLKSVALAAYPRRDIAAEHSDAWLAFLNRGLAPADRFEEDFALAAYRQDCTAIDTERLYRSTRAWIRQHRVAS